MYAGQVVERAPAAALFAAPGHPYTAGLLRSVPTLDDHGPGQPLPEIPGLVPALHEHPAACRFQDRCPYVAERCRKEPPALLAIAPERLVRCHFPLHKGPTG
jgi:peptide/nickel transport system ATP-binding protein